MPPVAVKSRRKARALRFDSDRGLPVPRLFRPDSKTIIKRIRNATTLSFPEAHSDSGYAAETSTSQAMKSRIALLTLATAALVSAPAALHAADSEDAPAAVAPDNRPVYVGVELIPVDAPTRALFKLPAAGGLLVIGVAPESPADGKLGQGDILVKLGDQLLVNREQLRTLLRAKKSGDEATFEVARGGRTESVVVKLAAAPGFPEAAGITPFPGGGAEELLRRLNERTRGMMRDSGLDRDFLSGALGNASVSVSGDDSDATGFHITTSRSVTRPEGQVTVVRRDGKKSVTVKDAGGKTLVEGELTDALRAKLPDWAKETVDGDKASAKPAKGVKPRTPVAVGHGGASDAAA